MGAFKPLLPIRGKPMIAHTADVFLRAGVKDLYVVVGKLGEDVIQALSGYHAEFLWNHDFAQTEMFASVQLGLRAIRETGNFDAAFLLPGDMPAVEPQVLCALLDALETNDYDVVFPSDGARRLHPPLIRASAFDALIDYSGEDGLRGAFRTLGACVGYVVTSEAGCAIDVDTPEDYERARAFFENREGEVKSE
jgi:CTP:molybdopterin cytidylyltransferase MocA